MCVYSSIGTSPAAAPYNPAGHHAWHVYGLNSAGQVILITIDLILEDIFAGNSGLCIANYQLALGQIMGVGASVGPVAGRGGGRSGGSKCRRWTGSASMGAGRSNGGYSREPGRGGIGAGASSSSNNVWPSRCSGSAGPRGSSCRTGPRSGGVGAGPVRCGTAAGKSISNVSRDLPATEYRGCGILYESVT